MATSHATSSENVSVQDTATHSSSSSDQCTSVPSYETNDDHGHGVFARPVDSFSTPDPSPAQNTLSSSQTLGRSNIKNIRLPSQTALAVKLNKEVWKSSCDHHHALLHLGSELASWRDRISALEGSQDPRNTEGTQEQQGQVITLRRELTALREEHIALRDRVALLENEAYVSRCHEARSIAQRTEELLLSQEECRSALKQGADISRTLTGDLFVRQSDCENQSDPLSILDGLNCSTPSRDILIRNDATMMTANLVLRDRSGSPAGSVDGNTEREDLRGLAIDNGDTSPSQLRQIRRDRNKASKQGSRRSSHLRSRTHKAVHGANISPRKASQTPNLDLGSPITIPDSMSSDASSIPAGGPHNLKRSTFESFPAEDPSPVRKKRLIRSSACEPSPELSEESSAETREILAAFGILEDRKEAQKKRPELEVVLPLADRAGGRPQRRAAVKAGLFVKDICEQFPIIYTSPKKLVKGRGRK